MQTRQNAWPHAACTASSRGSWHTPHTPSLPASMLCTVRTNDDCDDEVVRVGTTVSNGPVSCYTCRPLHGPNGNSTGFRLSSQSAGWPVEANLQKHRKNPRGFSRGVEASQGRSPSQTTLHHSDLQEGCLVIRLQEETLPAFNAISSKKSAQTASGQGNLRQLHAHHLPVPPDVLSIFSSSDTMDSPGQGKLWKATNKDIVKI